MKRILGCIILMTGLGLTSEAQELGLRFGDVVGGNVAIDGVFATSKFSRIHADVSFGDGGLGVDALWDFIYRPLEVDVPGFYWYVGAGPSLYLNDPFALGAAGELGIDYRFEEVPISLSVDWRPTLRIVEDTDMLFGLFGLNIRYVFSK